MVDQPTVNSSLKDKKSSPRVISFPLPSVTLYKQGELASSLAKEIQGEEGGESEQLRMTGERQRPYRYDRVHALVNGNCYHSACLRAKAMATVGLGFESEADRARKVSKATGVAMEELPTADQEISKESRILDPLCFGESFLGILMAAAIDYHTIGFGAIEVVRETEQTNSRITGLHHFPAWTLKAYVEDARARNWHWRAKSEIGGDLLYARFGDVQSLAARRNNGGTTPNGAQISFAFPNGARNQQKITELLVFKNPNPLNRFYGRIDYLSAIPMIELSQMLTQNEYDFYLNRAVPEIILSVTGPEALSQEDVDEIKSNLVKTLGSGNQRKTMFLNLSGSAEAAIQVDKLALESSGDGNHFATGSTSIGTQIVSAHGVPPLLAGIQIPGRLGAANESIQALQLFQVLLIGPSQNLFTHALRCSLGDPSYNGGLGLDQNDFVLNTVLDEIDLAKADVQARMRQSPAEAEAEDRDLNEGVRE